MTARNRLTTPGAMAIASMFLCGAPGVFATTQASDPGHCEELGQRLFHDRRLSGSSVISCADCHDPAKGFTDGRPLSGAYPGNLGFRNTPALIGVDGRERWMWDGRIRGDLEHAISVVLESSILMNIDSNLLGARLRQDPVYTKLFDVSGYSPPTVEGAVSCIAEYLRSIAATARVEVEDKDAVLRGRRLFETRARCGSCHSGPLLTDQELHRTGVPGIPTVLNEDSRRRVALAVTARSSGWNGAGLPVRDRGAGFLEDRLDAAFLTPSLLGVSDTMPYMHNGVFNTLEEVIDHYDMGGNSRPNELDPLGLSIDEKADLLAYLESLKAPPTERSLTLAVDSEAGR